MSRSSAKSDESKSPASSLLEFVVIVATALGLALLIQAFLVKPYKIPTPSMVPTLTAGQRILVNRIATRFSKPEVGDIVVFNPPTGATGQFNAGGECGRRDEGISDTGGRQAKPCAHRVPGKSDETYVKRVVGGPGDTIRITGGRVIRNGKRQKEDFIVECRTQDVCNFPKPIKVPPGEYYMMGDNRGDSADSRYWGPVPEEYIIGGAFATYWPPKRIGLF